MVDHSLLRNGNKVLVDNQPYIIMDTDFVNPGKGQAFTKIKIKNLLNKKTIEKTVKICLLYTSPSPRDRTRSRMPSSA